MPLINNPIKTFELIQYPTHSKRTDKRTALAINKETNEYVTLEFFLINKNNNNLRPYMFFLKKYEANYLRLMYFNELLKHDTERVYLPNLLKYHGTYVHEDISKINDDQWIQPVMDTHKRSFYHNVEDAKRLKLDLGVMVTENRTDKHSLNKIVQSRFFSGTAMKHILIQIVYTLAMLHDLGYENNNLEAEFILIDENPAEDELIYEYDGKKFKVSMRYGKVLFHNWTFASSKSYPSQNEMYKRNNKTDIFTLLQSICGWWTSWQTDMEFARFKDFVVPISRLGEYITSNSETSICKRKVKEDGDFECLPLGINEPDAIKAPQTAIHHKYFDMFRIKDEPKRSCPLLMNMRPVD